MTSTILHILGYEGILCGVNRLNLRGGASRTDPNYYPRDRAIRTLVTFDLSVDGDIIKGEREEGVCKNCFKRTDDALASLGRFAGVLTAAHIAAEGAADVYERAAEAYNRSLPGLQAQLATRDKNRKDQRIAKRNKARADKRAKHAAMRERSLSMFSSE